MKYYKVDFLLKGIRLFPIYYCLKDDKAHLLFGGKWTNNAPADFDSNLVREAGDELSRLEALMIGLNEIPFEKEN